MKTKVFFIVFMLILLPTSFFGESVLNFEDRNYSVFLEAETGIGKVLYHTIQIGESGTNFNYITQGGQELLFPYSRYVAGVVLGQTHNIRFLYQPLTIETNTRFQSGITVDDVTFAGGTPMALKYGFPFWRLSYTYDFIPGKKIDLGVGGSLQLRNASISFASLNGEDLTISQNLGPVPAINILGRYAFDSGLYINLEIVGLYASSAIINGADFEFEGSILDAAIRGGIELKNSVDAFVNLRFLGGSAKGTSEYAKDSWAESVTSYTSNYLATMALTLGVTVK